VDFFGGSYAATVERAKIRPVRELEGFRRVHLEAGSSRIVKFTIGPAELRYWNAGVREYVLDASTLRRMGRGDSGVASLSPLGDEVAEPRRGCGQ
jgi:Fibronectin type III-like domain